MVPHYARRRFETREEHPRARFHELVKDLSLSEQTNQLCFGGPLPLPSLLFSSLRRLRYIGGLTEKRTRRHAPVRRAAAVHGVSGERSQRHAAPGHATRGNATRPHYLSICRAFAEASASSPPRG